MVALLLGLGLPWLTSERNLVLFWEPRLSVELVLRCPFFRWSPFLCKLIIIYIEKLYGSIISLELGLM